MYFIFGHCIGTSFGKYLFFLHCYVNPMIRFEWFWTMCSSKKINQWVCVCIVPNCFAWIHMSKCVHSLTSTKNTYHTICLSTLGFRLPIEIEKNKRQILPHFCLQGNIILRLTAIENRHYYWQYGVCHLLKSIFVEISMHAFEICPHVKSNEEKRKLIWAQKSNLFYWKKCDFRN